MHKLECDGCGYLPDVRYKKTDLFLCSNCRSDIVEYLALIGCEMTKRNPVIKELAESGRTGSWYLVADPETGYYERCQLTE